MGTEFDAARVSVFRTAFAKEPEAEATLRELLDEIRSDEHKDEVLALRRFYSTGAAMQYAEKKKRLVAVCVSGTCTTRSADVPMREKFVAHNGFLQADLDVKENPQLRDMAAVKALLRNDPHVAAYFVSPSGEGLKAIVRVPADAERHRLAWEACAAHFRDRYGLVIDKATKDPLRLCFVSWDPEAWVRDGNATELPLPKRAESTYYGAPRGNATERGTTEADVEEMLRFIPPRPDYETWMRVSSAVWAALGESAGTAALMRWSPEEKPGEYAAKFKHRLEQVGIGTLVFLAKQHGYDVVLAARRARWCGRAYFGGGLGGERGSAPRVPTEDVARERADDTLRRADTPAVLNREFLETALAESQVGAARIFAEKMRGKIVFDHKIQLWRRYNRGVWERDETGETRLEFTDVVKGEFLRLIDFVLADVRADPAPAGAKDARLGKIDKIRKAIENLNKKQFIEASLDLASSMLASLATEFDANPYLAACENGTLDLRIGDFREHSPADKITLRFPVSFDINAECPHWDAFVESIFGGNADTIRYVQRAVGYSLSGLTNEDALFFLIGSGANGKSVFRSALEMLFGDYRSEISIGALLTTTSDSNVDYQKARLKGARLAFTDEVPENKRFNESQIKAITGRDTILARNPYEKPYSFQPTHKLWLIGNHKPAITGTDNGIWRRINIIPFNVIFPKEKQIKPSQFHSWFRSELPGILNWALRGWLDYQANGLMPPEEVVAATSEYRSEQDQIGAFIEENLKSAPGALIRTATLFSTYREWCNDNGEFPVCRTKNKLTMKLKELGYTLTVGKGRASFLCGYNFASSQTPTLNFSAGNNERFG